MMGFPIGLATRAVIVFALLAMLGFAVHYIHENGEEVERGRWEKDRADRNAKAADAIRANAEHVRAVEQAGAQAATIISGELQKQLKEKDNEIDRMRVDLRAGRLARLRDPGANGGATDGNVSGAVAGAGQCGGAGGAELSLDADEFLRTQAIRADKVVKKLAACQALLVADRKVCGPEAGK